jgi:hypothetical protein
VTLSSKKLIVLKSKKEIFKKRMQPKRKLQTSKVFVLMNESGASVAGNPCRNSGIMIGTIVGRRSPQERLGTAK